MSLSIWVGEFWLFIMQVSPRKYNKGHTRRRSGQVLVVWEEIVLMLTQVITWNMKDIYFFYSEKYSIILNLQEYILKTG